MRVFSLKLIIYPCFICMFLTGYLGLVEAEFSCQATVSYKWQSDKQSDKQKSSAAKAENEEKNSEKLDEKSAGSLLVKDVFFSSFQVLAATEEEAKTKIHEASNKMKTKSDTACKELHENKSKCLSSRYVSNAGILSSLSYEQRKKLEDSIVDDCSMSSGQCLGSTASEPKCQEVKKAEGEETPAAEAGGKDKDKKKK